MSLSDSSKEVARLNQLLEDGFDDLAAIKEVLPIRQASLSADVDNVLGAVRYFKMRGDYLENLKIEVLDAIAAAQHRLKNIREYVRYCMSDTPGAKFRGKTGEFAIQKNGGVVPLKLKITTHDQSFTGILPHGLEQEIDQKYLVRHEFFTLNKAVIRQDLDDGIKLPELAEFGERGDRVVDKL
jgi:hypothetical protein